MTVNNQTSKTIALGDGATTRFAMRKIILAAALFAAGILSSVSPAAAQGCGPSNPSCIVPTAPPGTSTNQAASTKFVQQAISGVVIPPLPAAQLFIGSMANVATAQALTGDCSITISGTITCPRSNGTLLGSMAFQNSGSVAITGGAIACVNTPLAGTDCANKTYVDNISAGLTVLAPVRVATAAALAANTYANGTLGVGATLTATANGALTVDSVAVSVSDRVLVKNEATLANNGIYTVTQVGSGGAPYILTRSTDYDQAAEMSIGVYLLSTAGAANAGNGWARSAVATTVGTTAVVFNQYSPASVAQPWTISGANVYYNSGNVGIRNTTPAAPLHVGSAGIFNSSGQIRSSTCNSDCSGSREWLFGADFATFANYGFNILDTAGSQVAFNIDLAGKIGVNTTTPTNDLTIKQSVNTQAAGGLKLVRSGGTSSVSLFQGGDDHSYLLNNAPGNVEIYNTTTQLAEFKANGQLRLPSYSTAGCLANDTSGNISTTSCGGAGSPKLLNVRNYGAGVGGNDAAAFQAAVNALTPDSSVYIPCGTYTFTASVIFTSTVHVFGDDVSCVLLVTNSAIPIFVINTPASGSYYNTIRDVTFVSSIDNPSVAGIQLNNVGSPAIFAYSNFVRIHCLGTNVCIRNFRNVNVGGEAFFDWNKFTEIATSNNGGAPTRYAFYTDNGSGTGNVYSNMNLVAANGGIYWGGANGSNIGDITISNIQHGGGGSGVVGSSAGAYRNNISVSNSQYDAGLSQGISLRNYTGVSVMGISTAAGINDFTGSTIYCGSFAAYC